MKQSLKKGLSLAECVAGYDLYALEVRGLAASTREMHRRLLRRFCAFSFVEEPVLWNAVWRAQHGAAECFRPYPFYTHVLAGSHRLTSNFNALEVGWAKQQGRFNYSVNYT